MKDYTKHCGIYFEQDIEDEDFSYLVIFGYHINGAFISVPNWKICIEASDLQYNENFEKLIIAGFSEKQAKTISEHINNWIANNFETVEKIRNKNQELYLKYLQLVLNKKDDRCENE